MVDRAAEGASYGGHLPGTAGYRRLNVAMVAAAIAAFGILYAAQPLLPLIAREYSVTPSAASLTVSGSTGALALGVLPLAALADRWGRVRAMRASLVAATVLTALAAAAPTFEVLVGLRMAGGLALAVVTAVAMGHVGGQVAPAGLGAAMGLYVAGNSIGGVTGRVLGSAVADLGSWRWAVLAVAVLASVATVVFWRVLPAPVEVADGPRTAGRWRTLLRDPAVIGLTVLPFVLMGGFVAVYNYLSFRLVAPPFSLPAALVGLVFLAYLAGTLASAVAGRVADVAGRPVVLLAGLAVSATGLAVMLADGVGWVVAGLLVFTTGFFVAHATASGWMQSAARRLDARSGDRAGALYVTAYYAGSGVFGALVGLAWQGHGWPGVTVAVAGLLAVAALAAAAPVTVELRRRRPGRRGPRV